MNPRAHVGAPAPSRSQFKQYKIIYRRYAGLFFTLCVVRGVPSCPASARRSHRSAGATHNSRTTLSQDVTDNELVYFESIHLFVELLDQFFGNVCELDLVFNFNKVYMILDEFFLAGEVQETSKQAILHRVQELDKLE